MNVSEPLKKIVERIYDQPDNIYLESGDICTSGAKKLDPDVLAVGISKMYYQFNFGSSNDVTICRARDIPKDMWVISSPKYNTAVLWALLKSKLMSAVLLTILSERTDDSQSRVNKKDLLMLPFKPIILKV